ncbi:unnamed protein product [Caenorhabditis auriculariae]|uniref:K Homology domain-containing protein n=1 Tax=Caenorhabditis auriculariae TaxID=2777116 RepID=A0A8S1HNJ9_9PELO|nr:unnamed protein product [Caenorhabditis auriculariae]
MSFPLHPEKYLVGRCVFRRNPYSGGSKRVTESHDTPDLYAIVEVDETDDGPSCAVAPENIKKPKVEKNGESSKKTVGKPVTQMTPCSEDPRIVSNGAKWMAKIFVPNAFMGMFIGMHGQARRELEDSTNCRLKTPRRGSNEPVEITSFGGLDYVQRCMDRIELFNIEARKTARVTHFVAIPCNLPDVMTSFEAFRHIINGNEAYHETCKKPKLFTSKDKLHVTISVLWVFTDEDMAKVTLVLNDVRQELKKLFKFPLMAELKGIDIMNDDPHNAQVLFAKLEGENVQEVTNLVKQRLVEAGLARHESLDENVKIHVTLMNSRYIVQSSDLRKYHFDASKILENFKDYYFGPVQVNEICLCPLNSQTGKAQFYPKLSSRRECAGFFLGFSTEEEGSGLPILLYYKGLGGKASDGTRRGCFFHAAVAVLLVGLAETAEDLVLVDGGQPLKIQRRSPPRQKLKSRDLPVDDVIHAPVDNQRVFTKENFYINGMHPMRKEMKMYLEMLTDGKGSIQDIDSYFVTPPPRRTTILPRGEPMTSSSPTPVEPDVSRISNGSHDEDRHQLRLVTLPPTKPTTPPPYKHNSLRRRHILPAGSFEKPPSPPLLSTNQQSAPLLSPIPQPAPVLPPLSLTPQADPIGPTVRFPAQAWQVPPLQTPSAQPTPFGSLFDGSAVAPSPLAPPPNPFFPTPYVHQPTTPIVRNDSYNPFIPIPLGPLPQLPSLFQNNQPYDPRPPPPIEQPPAHRTPVRVGSFARSMQATPIPLLSSASYADNAYSQEKERELSEYLTNAELVKKPTPQIEYSVDSFATMQKPDEQPVPPSFFNAKTFVAKPASNVYAPRIAKPSENLKNFAKVHPQVVSSLQRPMVYRGHEIIKPKSNSTLPSTPYPWPSNPPPIVPIQASKFPGNGAISGLNPNAKLDLCCRKQRVSPVCQSLCNFDTFNDKTLMTAFLTNQCPGPQLGHAYECASSRADHTACCERTGVVAFQGGKCLPFCRTHVATPSNVLDYFVCLQVFESIKGCYRDHQLTHPNIFGD